MTHPTKIYCISDFQRMAREKKAKARQAMIDKFLFGFFAAFFAYFTIRLILGV